MTLINDGLTNVAAGLTATRDKAQNVTFTDTVDNPAYWAVVYDNSRFAQKVVDQIPEDCFRKWRAWKGDDDQNEAIEALEKRLGIRAKLRHAKQQARIFGEHYLYIDVQDGSDPSEPLNLDDVSSDSLRFIVNMPRGNLVEGTMETDPMSPNYGRPMYYTVSGSQSGVLMIDPSRVIRFHGIDAPSGHSGIYRGRSIFKAMITELSQYLGTSANIASLVYEAKIDIINVPDLASLVADPETEAAIQARYATMAFMKGNNGLILLSGASSKDGVGETYTQKNMSFATLPDILDRYQIQLAGASGIPRAILFGVSSGGMGSTGDLELSSYYDRISSMQENEIEPAIEILDECIIRSALGDRPEELWYSWNSLWQMTDAEKADVALKKAQTVKALVESQVLPPEVLTHPIVADLMATGALPGLDVALDEFLEGDGIVLPEPDVNEAAPTGQMADPEDQTTVVDYDKEAFLIVRDYLATE